jgi:hypothetical protein
MKYMLNAMRKKPQMSKMPRYTGWLRRLRPAVMTKATRLYQLKSARMWPT